MGIDNIKRRLSRLPGWLFSTITLLAILWLTLAPKPLGDDAPQLFPGADKLVHGIMFGFFAGMMLFDFQRRNKWEFIIFPFCMLFGLISDIVGILIEIAQLKMDMGRGFEYADIISDCVGSLVVSASWYPLQRFWVGNYK